MKNLKFQIIAFIALIVFSCEHVQTEVEQQPTLPAMKSSTLADMLELDVDIFVTTCSDLADFTGDQQLDDLPGPDGEITLREAITAANNTEGPNVIGFKIPCSDPGFDGVVFTIRPQSSYMIMLLDDGTTINGSSQTLFTGDTNPRGPEIVINGEDVDDGPGIELYNSDDHIIKGLVINNFPNAGIQSITDHVGPSPGAHNNIIADCYIGTDPVGSIGQANGWEGIVLEGSNNQVYNNLVSGNWMGISIYHGSNNSIYDCKIGTDRTGAYAIKNEWGLVISGQANNAYNNLVSGNWIGISTDGDDHHVYDCRVGTNLNGTAPLKNTGFGMLIGGSDEVIEGNLVSGNGDNGIVLTSDGAAIINNTIGTDFTGNEPIPNGTNGGGTGVSVAENSINNLVRGNLIAFNLEAGVAVTQTAMNNTISQNSIFSNKRLGIDLGVPYHGDGVTPNDPGDVDDGPNGLMNYPVLTSAMSAPGVLLVHGRIDAQDPRMVTIEFFANALGDPGGDLSGYGEGATYLGSKRPNVQGKFVATLPPVAEGTLITATATDADGNTSEFSMNIPAKVPPPSFQ